jgi:penicillin V acylase-like amidase (Ntn superfamily)
MRIRPTSFIAALSVGLLATQDARACTRVLWNDNGYATMVGRSMDWPESTEPLLYLLPRGMARDGGLIGGATAVADNPARWTSKYGSVIASVYGIGTADGVNEAGLAAHMLYLSATDFGPRDPGKAGVQAGLWAQHILDNAATVAEAIALMDDIQVVMVEANGHKATVHLAIEDAGGDSAIFEYVDGKLVVHHGREHTVMTNDPIFSEQLKIFAQQDFSKPDSSLPIPGNVNAKDRFARSHYFLNLLPDPKTEREAAASILSVMRNVSVPFGAPYKGFGIYNTEYRTAINLKDRRYYFELTNSPSTLWVDLGSVNLEAGAPVRMLDPDDIRLAGDVTSAFVAAPAPF